MKKTDELREECRLEDLDRGVRGKFYRDFTKGTKLVLPRPEVAQAFSTPEALNDARQSLIDLATRAVRQTKRSSRAPRKRRAS